MIAVLLPYVLKLSTQPNQGVADIYTDPQMHTVGTDVKVGRGQGNLGQKGIEKFLKTHQCNAICRYLKLNEINSRKNMEIGTMPAKPFMAHRSVEKIPSKGVCDFLPFGCVFVCLLLFVPQSY